MDERYFSNNNREGQPAGGNRYTDADYFDETFSLKFKKGQGNAQSFEQQRIDDDESFVSFAQKFVADDIDRLFNDEPVNNHIETVASPNDRTPKGAPVAPVTPAAHSPLVNTARAPVAAPAYRKPSQSAQNSHGVFNSMPGDPSRVPSGEPVDGDEEVRSKKSVALRIIVSVLLVLIAVAGAIVWYFLGSVDKKLDAIKYDDSIVDNVYLPPDAPVSEEVINILLIGSDERADGSVKGQRSDTMILLSIDTKNKQIKLASFLRDSYVYIPCLGKKGKMNSAYSADKESGGGAQGVMDTIEYNFGVDVHDYVSVDFEAFEKIVDLLGGVTIDGVTEKEAKYMNREADTNIKAGTNHMNGYEALWYCRIRKLDSDFKRTARQRKVLSAIIEGVKANPDKVLAILDEALPYVTTSISKKELKSMSVDALSYVNYEVVQRQVPDHDTLRDSSVNGSYVIEFDLEKNKILLQDFVYKKVEPEEEE